MSKSTLIAATLAAAVSETFRIPSQVWSPDADLTKGTYFNPASGTTITNNYDGRELAPRNITLLLNAGHGNELPADAEIIIEVKTYDEISGDGTPGSIAIPEQWEQIGCLTPSHKRFLLNFPVENCRLRKPESETPYGAICFGLYGTTTTTTTAITRA